MEKSSYEPGALGTFLDGRNSVSAKKKSRIKQKVVERSEPTAQSTRKKRPTKHKERAQTTSAVEDDGTSVIASAEIVHQEQSVDAQETVVDENLRTIFVGNVPLGTTRKGMKKLFRRFGEVDSVRIRSVIPGEERMSKKVATLRQSFSDKMRSLIFYVKFKERHSAQDALIMNGEKLAENTLRVDCCAAPRNYSGQTTIFIGNIPYDTQDDQLINFFKKSGDVSFVRIVRDPRSGIGKGFAFVAFNDSASIPLSLKMDGAEFRGRPLRVTRVQKKKKRAKEHSSQGPSRQTSLSDKPTRATLKTSKFNSGKPERRKASQQQGRFSSKKKERSVMV